MIKDPLAVTSQLDLLERAELIRRAQLQVELEYLFKHGLVQETAYDSLLRNDRRRLHRLVAETLERDSTVQDELTLRLAQHWDHAGEPRRALDYYARAGEHASRRYANAEALMAYDRACELAEELGLSAAQRLVLIVPRGRVLEHNGSYADALASYERLEQLAQTERDRATELQALIHRATLYATPNALSNTEEAEKLSERALEMARELGDRTAEAKVLWNLSIANFFGDRNAEGVRYGEASVAIARELNLREELAYTLNDLARAYLMAGRGADGREAMVEAEALWREVNNLPMLADTLISMGYVGFFSGDYLTPRAQVMEGLQLSQELGNLWGQAYAHETLGMLYAEGGESDRALEHLLEGAELGARASYLGAKYGGLVFAAGVYQLLGAADKANGLMDALIAEPNISPGWLVVPNIMRSSLQTDAGNLEDARATLTRAEATIEGLMGGIGVFFLHVVKTQLLLAEGQAEAALAEARAGIGELEASDLHPFRAWLLYEQALALEQMGKLDDAIEAGEIARREAETTGNRSTLWEILGSLARMVAARGDADAARELKQKALEEVRFVSDQAPPELRDGFWNRPQVRALSKVG